MGENKTHFQELRNMGEYKRSIKTAKSSKS